MLQKAANVSTPQRCSAMRRVHRGAAGNEGGRAGRRGAPHSPEATAEETSAKETNMIWAALTAAMVSSSKVSATAHVMRLTADSSYLTGAGT